MRGCCPLGRVPQPSFKAAADGGLPAAGFEGEEAGGFLGLLAAVHGGECVGFTGYQALHLDSLVWTVVGVGGGHEAFPPLGSGITSSTQVTIGLL
ncbi:hypothetical protein Skr01_33630 [Sphaerisporangium krabiense]|nr:hypothetical protein Skr01_33630 [Sphaerisporangium krabiense]